MNTVSLFPCTVSMADMTELAAGVGDAADEAPPPLLLPLLLSGLPPYAASMRTALPPAVTCNVGA